jgi:hypothetical protein
MGKSMYVREAFGLDTLMLNAKVCFVSELAWATGKLAIAFGLSPSTFCRKPRCQTGNGFMIEMIGDTPVQL